MSPLKPYQGRIIVLLTQQELLVAEIYRFFAGLFPDMRDFWDTLSREEMDHATWMEYLYKKVREGTVHFDEAKMRTYTVETFVKYLSDSLAKIKDKAPTLQGAFSLALDIENSMLIRRVFDHFRSTDRELSNLLLDLRSRMKEHRGRIEVEAASLQSAQKERTPRR
jgi:hypothetical protein